MKDKYQLLGDYHWQLYHGKEPCLYQKHVNKVVKFFSDKKGSLLDIGCGDGLILSELSKNKNLHCFGIDVSLTAIDIANTKGLTNCAIIDLLGEGIFSEYDYIYMGDVLEHLPDCEKGLRKAEEYLKPDGLILFAIPVQRVKSIFDFHFFNKELASDLIKKVFKIVSFEEEHRKIYITAVHKNA